MVAKKVVLGGALAGACLLASVGTAHASSGIDTPDNGVVQVGRGGAWVARADDPLAAYYNPAALVQQRSGVYLGAHLMFMSRCFTRLGPDGQPVSPGGSIPGPGAAGGPPAATCADTNPFPNPQIAANFRITRRLAIGLSVMGPHGVGNMSWPESLPYSIGNISTTQPAPQRYLLTESNALIINPTLSVSYAINDNLAIGAGFIWGIANISFTNFSESTSAIAKDDFAGNQDVKAQLKATDAFVPGFVVGIMGSPAKRLDVAGWFKWQDAIHTRTSLHLEANYWKTGGAPTGNPTITDVADAGYLKFRIPMEARLGFRYHHPLKMGSLVPQSGPKVRDPLTQDLFDLEVDFTWANNSVVDNMEVRFKQAGYTGSGSGIRVNGTPGFIPENADIPHKWKDVFGVRFGGDFTVIPGFLAVRAGGFFETKGQDAAYLNPDFDMGMRVGLGGGATVRINRFDISLAYQHTFFGPLDNGGKGAVPALSGDGTTNYRSKEARNGGRLESSLNEVALGGTVRF
jgi:long-chain fatty acid transport protein